MGSAAGTRRPLISVVEHNLLQVHIQTILDKGFGQLMEVSILMVRGGLSGLLLLSVDSYPFHLILLWRMCPVTKTL